MSTLNILNIMNSKSAFMNIISCKNQQQLWRRPSINVMILLQLCILWWRLQHGSWNVRNISMLVSLLVGFWGTLLQCMNVCEYGYCWVPATGWKCSSRLPKLFFWLSLLWITCVLNHYTYSYYHGVSNNEQFTICTYRLIYMSVNTLMLSYF